MRTTYSRLCNFTVIVYSESVVLRRKPKISDGVTKVPELPQQPHIVQLVHRDTGVSVILLDDVTAFSRLVRPQQHAMVQNHKRAPSESIWRRP